MKGFNELNGLELDTLREIGSIGTGNAANALSSMLGCKVTIEMPEVKIMGYNEAKSTALSCPFSTWSLSTWFCSI